ncbi:MAG: class I SAM-dependent methyltransferase [Dehalococcoidia bacterium]
MKQQSRSRVNDPATVLREYATEDRFLARRLTTWAELSGPLVEDATVDAVGEGRPDRVLEVGCGTGDFSARLQREVAIDLVALDLSAKMVALTSARGLNALRADIEALPFGDERFDCVLANRVLYHVPDLDQGLAEIARVLRPGGTLVAVTYSADHLRELSDLIRASPIATTFSTENGATGLSRHFHPVERRDFTGNARFPSAAAIRGLLEAYGDFADVDLSVGLGDVQTPFDATYRHAIFVAHKRS